MEKTNNNSSVNENTILAFHIGRGGRFNNPGHVTFLGQHVISDYLDGLFPPTIVDESNPDDPQFLDDNRPEAEWMSETGHHVGLTNEQVKSGIGRIDEDGEYDTTYTMYLKDIEPESDEWDAIFRETYYEDMELALAVAVNCISDEQIVHLTSREDIDGEEAELIRFTYGKYDDTCVAVRYNDGTIFFPYDWHSSYWDNEDWKIEDTRWIDVRGMEAINLNGMPRLLL